MNVHSIRLSPKDAELARQIAFDVAGSSVSVEHAMQFLLNESNILIAGMADEQPVGFISAHILDRFKDYRRKLFIYEVDVLHAFRRNGVGTAMLTALFETTRTSGVVTAFVLTNRSNHAALGLYSSTGGHEVHPDDVMFEFGLEPQI
jgi:ribosomal protein S18 acetylase RimI-like enzyme